MHEIGKGVLVVIVGLTFLGSHRLKESSLLESKNLSDWGGKSVFQAAAVS